MKEFRFYTIVDKVLVESFIGYLVESFKAMINTGTVIDLITVLHLKIKIQTIMEAKSIHDLTVIPL